MITNYFQETFVKKIKSNTCIGLRAATDCVSASKSLWYRPDIISVLWVLKRKDWKFLLLVFTAMFCRVSISNIIHVGFVLVELAWIPLYCIHISLSTLFYEYMNFWPGLQVIWLLYLLITLERHGWRWQARCMLHVHPRHVGSIRVMINALNCTVHRSNNQVLCPSGYFIRQPNKDIFKGFSHWMQRPAGSGRY